MPAYRSPEEAEIRKPVVARLRELMPGARIIHEIQSACQGPTRIDVLAVSTDRIAAVEIKSSKDKLDRLPAQLSAMCGCAHHPIVALHRKFFEIKETPNAGTWINAPEEAGHGVIWGFDLPQLTSAEQYLRHELQDRWRKWMACPPPGAIDMLWRDELREIASRCALHSATSRLTIPELIDVMTWHLTGAEITKEVCAALRARKCVEADPPIETATPDPGPGPDRLSRQSQGVLL